MDTNEIINILENENLTLKFRKIENIPMGRSIHFSFSFALWILLLLLLKSVIFVKSVSL